MHASQIVYGLKVALLKTQFLQSRRSKRSEQGYGSTTTVLPYPWSEANEKEFFSDMVMWFAWSKGSTFLEFLSKLMFIND